MQPGRHSPGVGRPGPEGPRVAAAEPSPPPRPRRLGVLSPRPVPWVRSPEYTPKAATARRLHRQRESVEMQDGARHVALHTPRLPPTTSSLWPAGARAPGLPPLRPPLAGCTPAVLSARQAECWPGLCQGLLFLRVHRRLTLGPGGHLEPPAPLPPLLTPSSFLLASLGLCGLRATVLSPLPALE